MWFLIVAIAAALVAFVALALWQGRLVTQALTSRDCPLCGEPLEEVTDGPAPDRSYEVLACSKCATIVTTVHGARSRFAYCPSCRQLSLDVHARTSPEAAVIELREHCTICDFEADRALERVEAHEGKVIPFPGPRSNAR